VSPLWSPAEADPGADGEPVERHNLVGMAAWQSFRVDDIADGNVAAVLGLIGLFSGSPRRASAGDDHPAVPR
jgi:hypothetical protein